MTNKIKSLYVVTYYNAENERDWSVTVADSYENAIDNVIQELMELVGLEDGEELGFSDFQAFEQAEVSGYKIVLVK